MVQSDMTKGAESSTNMAALGRGLWRKGGGTLVSQVDTPHHHCHHHQIMSVLLSSVLRLLFLPGFFLLLDGGHLRPPSHGGEAWRGQSWPPFPGVHCRLWARLPPSLSPKLSSVSVARATGAQLVSKCQAAGLGSDAGGVLLDSTLFAGERGRFFQINRFSGKRWPSAVRKSENTKVGLRKA